MPAFNEAEYLEAAVTTLAGAAAVGEVIVVENGSSDGTAEVARGLEKGLERVRALSLPDPDYGAALKAGFLAAQGEFVVNFDVDYFDLGFLTAAVARLEEADRPAIVVGSKRAPGAQDERPFLRRLVTSTFSMVLRRGFGLRVSDTHGMKGMRREAVLAIVEECRFGTDLFDTELILRAERAGLLLAEIPVAVIEQRPARTSILRRGVRTVRGLVRLRAALGRH
jgi:glycosyltransferase involved in cell wall biosynthesis